MDEESEIFETAVPVAALQRLSRFLFSHSLRSVATPFSDRDNLSSDFPTVFVVTGDAPVFLSVDAG